MDQQRDRRAKLQDPQALVAGMERSSFFIVVVVAAAAAAAAAAVEQR